MEPIVPVEIDAGAVRLRPWREDDVEAVWAAQQEDEVIRRWAGGVATLLRRLMFQENRASWAAVDGGTGALLGSVSLHSIDVVQGDASIGYWTVAGARGRGIAPVAVDAVCRWAFATLAVDRIELCHAVENAVSGRVAEKAGFTCEGHLRRSFRYGDGMKHDELLWSRLSDDARLVAPGSPAD